MQTCLRKYLTDSGTQGLEGLGGLGRVIPTDEVSSDANTLVTSNPSHKAIHCCEI